MAGGGLQERLLLLWAEAEQVQVHPPPAALPAAAKQLKTYKLPEIGSPTNGNQTGCRGCRAGRPTIGRAPVGGQERREMEASGPSLLNLVAGGPRFGVR